MSIAKENSEVILQQAAPDQEPVATVQCIHGVTIGYLEVMQPVGTKLYAAPVDIEALTKERDALMAGSKAGVGCDGFGFVLCGKWRNHSRRAGIPESQKCSTSGGCAMSLPPLPPKDIDNADCQAGHSDDSMQAYGQQCRETALEEAAKACQSQADQLMYPSTGNAIALVCAGKIRSMK